MESDLVVQSYCTPRYPCTNIVDTGGSQVVVIGVTLVSTFLNVTRIECSKEDVTAPTVR